IEDTDGSIGNNQGILANFTPEMGLPIMGTNAQDGLLPGNPIVPNILGLTNELDPIDQVVGGSIQISNGTIAALGGVEGVTSSNHVLLGQFTTDGDFSFELNIQLATPVAGGSEIYVASAPAAGEFTDSTLIYNSNPSAGLEENLIAEAMNNLVVSPNPAVDELQMNWLTYESTQNYQMEVMDLEGKIVMAVPNMTNSEKIDIKDLQAGVYIVKVKSPQRQATQRFIKL
ncbi:MAG: T9SS C-terminal target domain-containing protein, partial [Flavobacteriia bacterium]|nr:T9SS C-terminal target domain-containing protein [Flavobacteriia bacterium]